MLSIPVVDGGVGVVVVVIVVVASPEKKIMFRSVRGKLFSQRVLTSFSQCSVSSRKREYMFVSATHQPPILFILLISQTSFFI